MINYLSHLYIRSYRGLDRLLSNTSSLIMLALLNNLPHYLILSIIMPSVSWSITEVSPLKVVAASSRGGSHILLSILLHAFLDSSLVFSILIRHLKLVLLVVRVWVLLIPIVMLLWLLMELLLLLHTTPKVGIAECLARRDWKPTTWKLLSMMEESRIASW